MLNFHTTLFAAAFLMRADAFAPARMMAPSRIVSRSSALQMASDKPLTELCEITKEACEAVAPMLNGK